MYEKQLEKIAQYAELLKNAPENLEEVKQKQEREKILEQMKNYMSHGQNSQIEISTRITEIKASIADQIERGFLPYYPLRLAVEAIGLITKDAEWEKHCKDFLDLTYEDLAQQSLFVKEAAEALKRQESLQEKWEMATRKQLKTTRVITKDFLRQLEETTTYFNSAFPEDG